MQLTQLGWNSFFENHYKKQQPRDCACVPGRVSSQSKGIFRIVTETGESLARMSGRMRHRLEPTAGGLPAVGDWVIVHSVRSSNTPDLGLIERILPRKTILLRRDAGRAVREQVLAANFELVFVVTSLNQEWSARRLERYLSLAWESGASPVVLLTKVDLLPDGGEQVMLEIQMVAPGVPVHAISVFSGRGLPTVSSLIGQGQTAVFIGSSGVGKSTLINALSGSNIQPVGEIRCWDDRGRHTTTSRDLFLLPSGGLVIDTPGLRKLGMWQSESGTKRVFSDIGGLSTNCRFRDCTHTTEPGCAVLAAEDEGTISPDRVANYRKLQEELNYLKTKTDWQAARAAKSRAKNISKAIKRLPGNKHSQ